MGRIPAGSLESKDSMSACRGKGAAKQGTPPQNRENAMVESAAPEKLSAKGAFREPPVERITTSVTANNRRSNPRTAIKSAVVGSARATSASEGTQMSPKFELGLRKEVERGTAHGKCARQKGRNAQGEAAKRRSETSEAEDTIVEKRVVDDVKLRKPARPHDGFSRNVTRVACPGRQANAAEMGLGEWSTLATFSFRTSEEPKRSRNDALRSHSLNSSNGSDSSSSFSTFESSSSSCKSEPASAFAKGYSSPATELKPPELLEVLVACVSPELDTESARKWDDASKLPSDGSNCELSKAVHSNMHRRELVEDEFLEFNFLEGRLVESQACRRDATENLSGCCRSQNSNFEEKNPLNHDAATDEEWANHQFATSAFYSASTCSHETFSETSDDANNRPSIERSSLVAQLQDAVSPPTQVHASTELYQHHGSETDQGSDHDFHSAPFEADIDVDTVLLKSNTQPRRKPDSMGFSDVPLCENFDFPGSFSPNRHEDGFSFQAPSLWSDSTTKVKSSLSRSPPSIVNNGDDVASVDHGSDAESVLVPSKGNSVREFWDIPVMEKPLLALNTFPHQDVWKTKKAFSLSPLSFCESKHAEEPNEAFGKAFAELLWPGMGKSQRPLPPRSVSKIKHSEMPDEPIRKACADLLWPSGTSESQSPVFSASKAHWDWRSKSLGAKAGLKSAVRNLEAAFAGSRSTSLPKTRVQTSHKDLKTESSSLLDRVFASPMRSRHKHAENFKPVEISTRLDDHLRRNQSMRSGLPPRRDAKPLALSLKSLAMDSYSNRTMASAQVNHMARPLPLVGYKYRNSNLEVSCKPFLPASRSVRCLPAPKVELGSGSPASTTQKPTNSSSSRSDVAPPSMLQGSLQCTLREGVPCYTLTVDDSEEMLLARACMSENHSSKDGCKWMYTFHSGRSKGKGKGTGGWRSWGRKDKTASELAGKMKISSVLCAEVSPTGQITHSVVSEFVLFDGIAEDTVRSQSLRFWSSENKPTAAARSMGESAFFRSHAPSDTTSPASITRMQTPENRISTTSLNSSSVESDMMSPRPQLCSPIKVALGHRSTFSLDFWSETELTDSDVGPMSSCPSHMELAAMIIRVPAKENESVSEMGSCYNSKKDAWGWGLNFLDSGSTSEAGCAIQSIPRTLSLSSVSSENIARGKAFGNDGFRSRSSMSSFDEQSSRESRAGMVLNSKLKSGAPSSTPLALPLNSSQKPENFQHGRFQTAESVTILLPVGDHSLPNGESSGPSSLIERWRSGGKCDCGGWDLGCGLTVLSIERSNKCNSARELSIQSLSQTKPVNIFSQGSSEELILSLSAVQQGSFMLTFQAQLTPLQAFASAVAILHSKEELPLPSPQTWIRTDSSIHNQFATLSCTANSRSEDKFALTFPEPYTGIPAYSPSEPPRSPFGRA